MRVADDADGRAAARLGAGERGIAEEPPAESPVQERKTGEQGLDRPVREESARRSVGSPAAAIAGGDRSAAGRAREKIAGPLDRCFVRTASRQISEPLDTLLVMDRRPADACCRFRSGSMVTTRPLLANGESWRLSLMPLVQK